MGRWSGRWIERARASPKRSAPACPRTSLSIALQHKWDKLIGNDWYCNDCFKHQRTCMASPRDVHLDVKQPVCAGDLQWLGDRQSRANRSVRDQTTYEAICVTMVTNCNIRVNRAREVLSGCLSVHSDDACTGSNSH